MGTNCHIKCASTCKIKEDDMPFTDEEIQSLLAVKGIDKTILTRLQQIGLDDIAKLAVADLDNILEQGAKLTGSTCWKNSPQAKAAIAAAIEWAKQRFQTA